jgi:release factor glutamine methyltransferase
MQSLIKKAAGKILIPVTKWYLRKPRLFKYSDLEIMVEPGVFHPGLFSSTLFVLNYLEGQQLVNRTVLELGCGSGLISARCATRGAKVTACDISPVAVGNASNNMRRNKVSVEVFESDLFGRIPQQYFDWIIINPPYYAKEVTSETEYAWNCGLNFEYFHKLFRQLPAYLHQDTFILMVLTKGCDLKTIFEIASQYNFSFEMIGEKNVLFDAKDFLYRVTPNSFQ